MRVAQKNAMAIKNEFFTKFFGIISPCLSSINRGVKDCRNPQVVNELADCGKVTFQKTFLFRLLPVSGRFLNGAKLFRVVRFGFGFVFGDRFGWRWRRGRFLASREEDRSREQDKDQFFHRVGFSALRLFGTSWRGCGRRRWGRRRASSHLESRLPA